MIFCKEMKKSILRFRYIQNSKYQPQKRFSSKAKYFSEIPQVKSLPLIGTLIDYTKFRNFNPLLLHKLYERRHKTYGPIFREGRTTGFDFSTVFTSSPKDVETMFRNEGSKPIRPAMESIMMCRTSSGLHKGVSCAYGDEWLRIRRVYNHVINNKNVWDYTRHHMEISNELVNCIHKRLNDKSEITNFDYFLYKWALECTIKFSLNIKLNALSENAAPEAESFIRATSNLFAMFSKLMFGFSTWKYFNTNQRKELKMWQDLQISSLEQFVKNNSGNLSSSSVLEQFLASTDLNSNEKKTVVYDILTAGVETTSNAVPFVLYCLATNPEKQETLRKEIQEITGSGQEITGKAIQQMEFLRAVHLESQRLFPLAITHPRVMVEDTVMSGYNVPSGTLVFSTSNIINGRNLKWFDKPDDFVPERWMEKNYSRENRFVMSGSFGMGPRMCPGRKLALQEMGCLLIALLSRYKIEYHYEPFDLSFNLTSKPFQKPNFTFLPL